VRELALAGLSPCRPLTASQHRMMTRKVQRFSCMSQQPKALSRNWKDQRGQHWPMPRVRLPGYSVICRPSAGARSSATRISLRDGRCECRSGGVDLGASRSLTCAGTTKRSCWPRCVAWPGSSSSAWFVGPRTCCRWSAPWPTTRPALSTVAAASAATRRPRTFCSPFAQRRHCFTVCTWPEHSTLSGNLLAEALHTTSPLPDASATSSPARVRSRCLAVFRAPPIRRW
jgi:hypothetical protein